jgi:C1A family cysteine protease
VATTHSTRTRKIKRYGWRPDLPDQRDHLYAMPAAHATRLPPKVDLRPQIKFAPYDQGHLGSCTANAIAAAFEFDTLKQGLPDFIPSRLFIYYNERAIEGTVQQDSGAQIRDGVKVIHQLGVCAEKTWPYSDKDPGPFQEKPSPDAIKEATGHKVSSYQRIPQALVAMKSCLAQGYPFVFGFTVYESFESEAVAQTGVVPMPEPSEAVLGGHAVLAVGFDDSSSRFTVRNSWGSGWGMGGYFTMPYEYLSDSNLADDFWTLRTITP